MMTAQEIFTKVKSGEIKQISNTKRGKFHYITVNFRGINETVRIHETQI